MTTDPFSNFDLSRFQTVSNLPLQTMVSMAKALEAAAPDNAPAHVDKVKGLMRDTSDDAEDAMIVRLREDNEGSASADQTLDIAVDPLWSLIRRRLDDWGVYMREGLNFVEDDPDAPPEVDIEELRDKATRARKISERLFGVGRLNFIQRPYAEQAQLMANVLGLIDTDKLEEDIIELTGPELLPMLRRCQVRYEGMVQARAMRIDGSAADLRTLRGRLRRLIVRYAGAVITMLDESEPETLDVVETALMPMLTIRPVPARAGAAAGEGEGEGELEGELEGEGVSVDEELGEESEDLGETG
ncbi:hypothetical protein ENSA5_38610 [Enhygromyxa salina]|uniref:Uncharacterized protein n=1 Tax=Enhygromyxa salina TaxID=215803 RepID=A0A2S9XRL5_9BACT|nr:hypothetical protein [Enhygromyxa salina]PRP95508.1 hypothetical protein ENSA5_38610 [Enhygromyxa salina]